MARKKSTESRVAALEEEKDKTEAALDDLMLNGDSQSAVMQMAIAGAWSKIHSIEARIAGASGDNKLRWQCLQDMRKQQEVFKGLAAKVEVDSHRKACELLANQRETRGTLEALQ